MKAVLISLFTIFLIDGAIAKSNADGTVFIKEGEFTPLYGFGKQDRQRQYAVAAFRIDKLPVTRRQFNEFILEFPEWSKTRVDPLYADTNYLKGFNSSKKFGPYPVTNVSWFATQAYCESKGGRLPTVLEWEFIAAASETKTDASGDPEFVERILQWYSKPSGNRATKRVGTSTPNVYGVHDLHGLIWEWTLDFNSVFVSGDNRQDGDKSTAAVCGAGPTNASNRSDYAAFMRYAMRTSVEARFAQPNLGFRCAYDVKEAQ